MLPPIRQLFQAVDTLTEVIHFGKPQAILLLQTNFVKMPVTTGLKIPYVAAQLPIAIGFFGMAVFAVYWALYYISKACYNRKNGGADE